MATSSTTTPTTQLEPIVQDAIYPLSTFMLRTGLQKSAIRQMRRQGLIVRRIGRRSYIRGSDFLAWYDACAEKVLDQNPRRGRIHLVEFCC